jgi:hypothetical protein
MAIEPQKTTGFRPQGDVASNQAGQRPLGRKGNIKIRPFVYLSLLIFVIVGGLPMLALPSFRGRLISRIQKLRDAAAGRMPPPVLVARVGENMEAFPTQYERPAAIRPQFPPLSLPGVTPSGGITIVDTAAPKLAKRRAPDHEKAPAEPRAISEPEPSTAPAETETPNEPVYQQGKIEQEAYDLLIKANDALAAMVGGTDPALKYKNWDAAKIDEDTYYVRVVFLRQPENRNVDYIWQVKISSKQVTPLSYNARNLSKP